MCNWNLRRETMEEIKERKREERRDGERREGRKGQIFLQFGEKH